jgi:NHLM bacteriocin system ABC transporter ATP-binding protein
VERRILSNEFDRQLLNRFKADEEVFSDAFASVSEVIIGKGVLARMAESELASTENAINDILHYYGVPIIESDREEQGASLDATEQGVSLDATEQSASLDERLESALRPHGIMRRELVLRDDWYRDAVGSFLGRTREGKIIALIPHGFSGYVYLDRTTGKRVRVNRKTAADIDPSVLCFYKPLPLHSLRMRDLLAFVAQSLSFADYAYIVILTLLVSLVSMVSPQMIKHIYSEVVYADSVQPLIAVFVMLIGTSFSVTLLNIAKSLMLARIETKTDATVRTASMIRIISLSPNFFRHYSSGELSQRMQYINALCVAIVDGVFSTVLTAIISLIYVRQIFFFAPALALPALGIMLAMLLLSIATMVVQMNITQAKMEHQAKASGILYSFLTGIQKIKLSGAERRAFSQWAKIYKGVAKFTYGIPMFLKLNPVFALAISLAGTVIIYQQALATGISVDEYMAFAASYALLSGAFLALSQIAVSAATIKPIFELVRPILEAQPEVMQEKRLVSQISGSIKISHLSFRYGENLPLILDDISLTIEPRQYIGIVGKSGCGKSTLMRLLLGFEQPQKGAIYYDNMDMQNVDLRSLRHNIGCVMQNGRLFPGNIYSNIVISAPQLTMDDAWEAAELAGIAEDIRQMPMGMHTFISEGSGGLSGGQRQRVIIARAIAPKPKVLLFDEATSALDNETQKIVTEALDSLECTRIVIAHRLSTIRRCDRILMLDGGAIVEDGDYETLMARNGQFAELVRRQQLVMENDACPVPDDPSTVVI